MSYAFAMKSMNCISTIGRMPMCPAPAAAPPSAISEMGESITRSSPNFASNPSVTLKAPPNAPMSSPMQKTFASRSISSKCPSRMASRYVISGMSIVPRFGAWHLRSEFRVQASVLLLRRVLERAPARGALVLLHDGATLAIPERLLARWIGIHTLERVEGLRHTGLLGFVGGCVDFGANAIVGDLEVGLLEPELLGHAPGVPIDRVVLPFPALDLALGDVRLVVMLRVALAPIR